MAIFGVGSTWEGEMKKRFFEEDKFILGWNDDRAKDLYSAVAALKTGDILYIKANRAGSRKIRVKGIGIVTRNFIDCVNSGEYKNSKVSDWESLFVRVAWICTEEFFIEIPNKEGKNTHMRAGTIYEEYLPYVQTIVIEKLRKCLVKGS